MADNDDDGGDLKTIDVRGAPHPDHTRLRDIAHTLAHELDARAVVLVTLRDEGCVSSTIVHCSVPESDHPEVGTALIRGLHRCIDQLDRALVHDAGNGGHQGETH